MSFFINQQIAWAKEQLNDVSEIPMLEAEVLLAHVLKVSRSHLIAFSDETISPENSQSFLQLVAKRKNKMPVSYLTGNKEFWSLNLKVTPDTLIPRPETELLIELALQRINGENKLIADLGTGSGAIALALGSERKTWKIYATDQNRQALKVAELNRKKLKLDNIAFFQGNWCAALPKLQFDAILSNPPYIAETDPHLQNSMLKYEPYEALVSGPEGLNAIQIIAKEAKSFLKKEAILLLEHGAEQGGEVRKILQQLGYKNINIYQDLAGLDRVTIAST